MEPLVKECSLEEWSQNSQKMYKKHQPDDIYIRSNTFCSLQFIGDEKEATMNMKAYCVYLDGQSVGWAACYKLSDKVMRIRGVFIHPEFRGKGFMRLLINSIIEINRKTCNKFIVYSRKSAVGAYRKIGFEIESRFHERQAIIYFPESRTYEYQDDQPLNLMTRSFTGV
jgi:GNAT superfamily N-acetyltransferase